MIFLLILLTVLIGTLMPVQAGLNAELTKILKHPFLGALISFATGTLVLGLIVLTQRVPVGDLRRFTHIPPQYFLGGIMGALFVGSSIFLIPRLGATTMMSAYVVGQLLMAVVIDHYGWLGVPSYPVQPQRILGIILLFVGLFLVVKKAA